MKYTITTNSFKASPSKPKKWQNVVAAKPDRLETELAHRYLNLFLDELIIFNLEQDRLERMNENTFSCNL